MPVASTKGKTSPIIYYGGIAVAVTAAYVYFSGDDTPAPAKAPAVAKSASTAASDAYVAADYKASYPALKLEVKDAFLPLVRKTPAAENGKENLPSTITGGGQWSYDGTVTVDNRLQGLLDEAKTGESDFVTVGQHWKHGRIKRISDSEIIIQGDDGTSATMKMGEPVQNAKEAPAPVAPVEVPPAALAGQIGTMDVNGLPAAGGGAMGGNNGNGGGGGWNGNRRGRRGGGMRGSFGGG